MYRTMNIVGDRWLETANGLRPIIEEGKWNQPPLP